MIRDCVRLGTELLRQQGVEAPRLDAQLLLAHALGTTRSALLSRLSEMLAEPVQATYQEYLHRRAAREPVAYIMGRQEFWGRAFIVTPSVLIPRPETETLVERAIQLASRPEGVAADLGTGTGCIATSFAAEVSGWKVLAIDISEVALAVARENLRRYSLESRVHLLRGSLLEPIPVRLDLVLANLPYVSTRELGDLQAEVKDWEPVAALDGGEDGLDLVRRLLTQLPEKLHSDGVCLLEIDPRQFARLRHDVDLLLPGWSVLELRDLTGRPRVAELRPFTPS